MVIGGISCATLGHGITEVNDDIYSTIVISHEFFGTENVIDNLKRSPKYESGLIVLDQNSMIKNPLTNMVCTIII